jgi:hypothetical protein
MISSTFFFLFSQLGVGMMLTLLFISPREIGNSFFKFASQTAAILLAVTLGFNFMFPSQFRLGQGPVVLLIISGLFTVFYNRIVGMEKYSLALIFLIGATVTGLLSITWDSLAFTRLLSLGGWEHWTLAINHVAATALLGSVMLTMVFGHWYLVIPRLSIEPLARLTKVLIGAIALRIVAMSVTMAVMYLEKTHSLTSVFSALMFQQGIFFWPRVIFGIIVPVVLAAMIWNTVQIRHTQAATGLLYLAVVALLFGEFFSKFLLFLVSISL